MFSLFELRNFERTAANGLNSFESVHCGRPAYEGMCGTLKLQILICNLNSLVEMANEMDFGLPSCWRNDRVASLECPFGYFRSRKSDLLWFSKLWNRSIRLNDLFVIFYAWPGRCMQHTLPDFWMMLSVVPLLTTSREIAVRHLVQFQVNLYFY